MAPPQLSWFIPGQDDQPVGPLTAEEVVRRFRKGEIAVDTLCWREGLTDWQPIDTIEPFRSVLAQLGHQTDHSAHPTLPFLSARSRTIILGSTAAVAAAGAIGLCVWLFGSGAEKGPGGAANIPVVRGKSEPVRAAASLYGQGKHQEAYNAVRSYIAEREEAAVGKLLQNGMETRGVRLPDAEAYLLRGELELLHANKIQVVPQGQALMEMFPSADSAARDSFEHAIELDPKAKRTVIELLDKALTQRLAATAPEKIAELAAGQAVGDIRKRNYLAVRQRDPTALRGEAVGHVESLVSIYDELDPETRPQREGKVPPRQISADEAARARSSFYAHLVPELLASLKGLTENELRGSPYSKAGYGLGSLPEESFLPLFADKTLPAGAGDLFNEILRCRLIQGRYDPAITQRDSFYYVSYISADQSENCYELLVAAAGYHPQELLPVLLKVTDQSSSLTARLLAHTPRPAGRPGKQGHPTFAGADAERVWRAAAASFNRVVLRHFSDTRGVPPDFEGKERWDHKYLDSTLEAWPAVPIGRISAALVSSWPATLEDDDFLFALAWNNTYLTTPDARRRMGPYEQQYGFVHYLSRFPNGRHAQQAIPLAEQEKSRVGSTSTPGRLRTR